MVSFWLCECLVLCSSFLSHPIPSHPVLSCPILFALVVKPNQGFIHAGYLYSQALPQSSFYCGTILKQDVIHLSRLNLNLNPVSASLVPGTSGPCHFA